MSVKPFVFRREWGWLIVAVAAATLFFSQLYRLWPLADLPLVFDRGAAIERAREHLESKGYDVSDWKAIAYLSYEPPTLDYLEKAFELDGAREFVREGRNVYRHRVLFKKSGDPHVLRVDQHPASGVIAWFRSFEEDDPGARLPIDEARALAEAEATAFDPHFPNGWEATASSSVEHPERTDHRFYWERTLSDKPELRERLSIGIAGDALADGGRSLIVPGEARREARAEQAPGRAMQTTGLFLLACATIAGFWFFLDRLRRGTVRLGRAFTVPGVIFFCLLGTYLSQTHFLFGDWEPLWPRWVSLLESLLTRITGEAWMLIVLLALVGAGDALDRERNLGRGDSLWLFFRGKFGHPAVGSASLRGFTAGMLCGVVMLAFVVMFTAAFGGTTSLQPRGFFYYALNSASPSASTLLFFLNVALLEELGYRFFSGTLIEGWLKRRWLAILIPAIVYGLTHTTLDFLPPATPWWGRAVVLTAVGCVWGWAFFKWDALTVVLSHWTADLFIFNWPRIGGTDDTTSIVLAALTMLVPSLPGIWMLLKLPFRGRREPNPPTLR